MFSDEIKSIHAALGSLAGKIGEPDWELVKQARANLEALRVRLEALEQKPVQAMEISGASAGNAGGF